MLSQNRTASKDVCGGEPLARAGRILSLRHGRTYANQHRYRR
jgi:hypothetical protein